MRQEMRLERVTSHMEVERLLKLMEFGCYAVGDTNSVKRLILGMDVVRLTFQIESLPNLVKNRAGGYD